MSTNMVVIKIVTKIYCSICNKNGQIEHYEVLCYTIESTIHQTFIYVYEHTIWHTPVQ